MLGAKLVDQFQSRRVLATTCIGLLVFGVFLYGCKPAPEVWQFQGDTMGSQYHVTVVNPPKSISQQALADELAARLDYLHGALSSFEDSSEISAFNNQPVGEWRTVSPDVYAVLQEAIHTAEISDGAFDVTVGPLIELWGFGRRVTDDRIPSEDEIKQTLSRIDYRAIVLNATTSMAKRTHSVSVNVSSLGDGYAADELDELLQGKGCQNYLVDVGGEMRARGLSPRLDVWRVAIEAPDEMPGTMYKALRLRDGWAVSTSGDYRNYFEKDGRRYSHMVDPKTGRPIDHPLASVTVMDRYAIRADSLSTAFMVMGPDKALVLAEKLGVAAFFIIRTRDGFKAIQSSGFEQFADE